jgi:hypothetical protein
MRWWVATPDHWHGLISIAAARAGKDIYCEKPLVNSVVEGRALCKAVSENKRILQTGSHERSTPSVRFACELVRNGLIGKVHTVRIRLPCSDGHHQKARSLASIPPEEPLPEGFDYDFLAGPSSESPIYAVTHAFLVAFHSRPRWRRNDGSRRSYH